MLTALAELTLRGTLVFALVWLAECAVAHRMHPQMRRSWWWLAALAFLLPLDFSRAPRLPQPLRELQHRVALFPKNPAPELFLVEPAPLSHRLERTVTAVWALGFATSLSIVFVRTVRTQRHWARERLCTDPSLLGLLEDAKSSARVTAPIGLVVSDRIAAPALLGWLRPRILFPASLAAELPPERIRAILLHELAHFRALDLALHGAFTFVCAAHWFNPFAHLAARRWFAFREVAADANALTWLPASQRSHYGETLLSALRHAHSFPPLTGALALGESLVHLKHRIVMITRHASLARLPFLAFTVALSLGGLLLLQSARADETADAKDAAVAAMKTWLTNIDAGDYGGSWDTAAAFFQKTLARDAWVKALDQVRKPLGPCSSRNLLGAKYATKLPSPTGALEGEFVLAQFNTSFENASKTVETVTFAKEPDGAWKAAGYFIKPAP